MATPVGSDARISKIREIMAEIGEDDATLAETLERIESFPVPVPGPEKTEALIARLQPLLPGTRDAGSPFAVGDARLPQGPLARLHALLRPQLAVLDLRLLAAGALLALAGAAGLSYLPEGGPAALIQAIPVFAILTVAYGFRSLAYGVTELEMACPLTPGQLVTARLVVVLAYAVVLSALATAVVAGAGAGYGGGYAALALSWLAPLLFLSGLTLYVSLRWGPLAGMTGSLVFWAAQIAFGDRLLFAYLLGLPGGPYWPEGKLLAAAAGVALMILGSSGAGRWANEGRSPASGW